MCVCVSEANSVQKSRHDLHAEAIHKNTEHENITFGSRKCCMYKRLKHVKSKVVEEIHHGCKVSH